MTSTKWPKPGDTLAFKLGADELQAPIVRITGHRYKVRLSDKTLWIHVKDAVRFMRKAFPGKWISFGA